MTDGQSGGGDTPTTPESLELSEQTRQYAEELTGALLGVDEIYREESGDDVGLAVLDLSDGRDAEVFSDYEAADRRFTELADEAATLPEPDRRTYYSQACESTRAFVEWRTTGLSFRDQVRRFLHVSPEPPTPSEIQSLRDDIADSLTALGYDSRLSDAAREWQADTCVPTERVSDVLSSILTDTRSRVVQMFDVSADAIPAVDVEVVSDVPFNAKCDYLNRRIVVNGDPTLTRPWLEKLAVHEGYPGHVTQFALRERWYENGSAPADGLLSVVNTASSAPFEGIADAGTRLLQLDDTSDELARLIGRYQAAVGTRAADLYHREGVDETTLRAFLTDRALFGDEGWVENRVKFLTAPERATLLYSYWRGEPCVTRVLDSLSPEQEPTFLRYLYSRLHSVETVGMFEEVL